MTSSTYAREYLERRVAEHDLGVPNGGNMSPDTVALAALVLEMDERLNNVDHQTGRLLEMMERKHNTPFLTEIVTAVVENKKAMTSIITVLIAALGSQIIQFYEVRKFLGLSGGDAVVLFVALILFIVVMLTLIFKHP